MKRNPAVGIMGLAVVVVVVGACALGPGPASPAAPTTPPVPSAQPTDPPPAAPTPAPASPTPAGPATASPIAAASCPPPAEGLVPPTASLQAPEASAVAGVLGSYDYCETSADGLPPAGSSLTPVRLESRMGELTVSLPDGTPFVGWRGTYTDLADGREMAAGRADFDAAVRDATFRGPTMGEWLLSLTLDLGDEVGSAIYYWRIVVP